MDQVTQLLNVPGSIFACGTWKAAAKLALIVVNESSGPAVVGRIGERGQSMIPDALRREQLP
jgi:hypothetical protein